VNKTPVGVGLLKYLSLSSTSTAQVRNFYGGLTAVIVPDRARPVTNTVIPPPISGIWSAFVFTLSRSEHSIDSKIQEYFLVSSDTILHVTDASFEDDVLKAGSPVLLDFWAEWCAPCKMIAPMLDEIADEFRNKVKIAKLNIDDNPKTPQRFSVRGIPTLILFKNGQVEGQKVGALRKADLAAFLESKL